MNIVKRIQNMLSVFIYENNVEANTVYVGYEERREILASNEVIYDFRMPDKDNEKIFGKDMVEVNKAQYLKVGYVADNELSSK